MNMDNTIRFGAGTKPFFELSPFYKAPFYYNGHYYKTLVHYWISVFYRDRDEIVDVITKRIDEPSRVINLARTGYFDGNNTSHLWRDFNSIDTRYILSGTILKFRHNPEIYPILMNTGSSVLVYEGYSDYLAKNNVYGRLLTKLRNLDRVHTGYIMGSYKIP